MARAQWLPGWRLRSLGVVVLLLALAAAVRGTPLSGDEGQPRALGKRATYKAAATCGWTDDARRFVLPRADWTDHWGRGTAPSSSGGSGRGGAPVTITLTKSKKAKATKRLAGRDAEPLEASADLTDSASHGLFARNLCPACPSGASVSPRSFWDGTWFAPRGVDTVYCCPSGRGTVTVTVTSSVGPKPTTPPPAAVIRGRIWYDNNKDNKYTPKTDTLLSLRWIIIRRKNGSILDKVRTDANGYYNLKTAKAYKNERMNIALLSAPGQTVGTFVTDSKGAGGRNVAVQPAKISGDLWYDHNKNGRLDAADKPIVNSAVEIRFLNNTLLKKVKTDAKGHFEFEYNRAPFAKLVIIGLSGKIRKTFRADGNGNAKIEIPLMPVIPKGTISALVYVDINGNQKMDGSEPGAAEISLDLKFAANGTFFRRVKTDTTGRFSILSVNLPNTKFQVVGPDGSTILGFITTDGQGTGTNVFYIPPSTIRATIFYDENRDGQYMDGERLLANANIEVRRKDGTIVAKVKTGSNGQFSLSVVPMNKAELQLVYNYTVIESFTTDEVGNADLTVAIPVPLGDATISGTVYWDLNKNDFKDSSDAVYAFKAIDIKFFGNKSLIRSMFTDAQGEFSFTMHAEPNVELIVSTKDRVAEKSFTADENGNANTDLAVAPATIRGVVWGDLNMDDWPDNTEPPYVGDIVIKYPNGTIVGLATTDVSGTFSINVVPHPNQPLMVFGADGRAISTFVTDGNGDNTKVNAPIKPGIIEGTIWYDLNKDGVPQSTETPIGNSNVEIRFANGTTIAGTVPTNSTGGFRFVGMPQPNQLVQVVGLDGTVYRSFKTDYRGSATQFIGLPPAVIRGSVWYDLSHDNDQQGNEQPYANTPVDIKWANGSLLARVTTNTTGGFSYPTDPYPDQQLILTRVDGSVLATFSTDAKGSAIVLAPIPWSAIAGQIWYDTTRDGFKNPDEIVLGNVWLEFRYPNGSLFVRIATNFTGHFDYKASPVSNQALNVYTADGKLVQNFTTDVDGDADVWIPLAKAAIQASVFLDINWNGLKDADEPALANSLVSVGWQNGTNWGVLTTNSTGGFLFPVDVYPRENIVILGPMGDLLANAQTDDLGDLDLDIPIMPGDISGDVFYDINSNGVRDDGEPPYAGPIQIRWANGTAYASAVANASGGFSIDVFPYSRVTLAATIPGGAIIRTFTTDANGTGVAILPIPAAKVHGVAYVDINKNGGQDADEPPFANTFVNIMWPNGTLFVRVPTNATGGFSTPVRPFPSQAFTALAPDGTLLKAFSTDGQGNATLSLAVPPADIQGNVFFDMNGNGVQDAGEKPLPNNFIALIFPNGSVFANNVQTNSTGGFDYATVAFPNETLLVAGPDGSTLKNLTTDAKGNAFVAIPLPAPTIKGSLFWDMNRDSIESTGDLPVVGMPIVILLSDGKTHASATTGPNGTFIINSVGPAINAQLILVAASDPTVPMGTFVTDVYGNGQIDIPLLPAQIQGSAWLDSNKDGTKDPAESTFNNSVVEIRWPNGTLLASLVTDDAGAFSFPVIPYPGQNFTVSAGGLPIKTFTTDADGYAIVLIAVPPTIISGQIWYEFTNDTDFTGTAGDLPLVGMVLQIKFANGSGYGEVTTDSNGAFVIHPGVPAPMATVNVVDPVSGKIFGKIQLDDAGSGQVKIPLAPVEIQGTAWYDKNRNNMMDAGEQPLNNSKVTLTWMNGTVLAVVPTNATGGFRYLTLPLANQTLLVSSPEGVALRNFTTKSDGSASVQVPIPPPRIVGTIYWDMDESGILTTGDKALGGEKLLIIASDGSIYANVTTLANGTFILDPKLPMVSAAFTVVRTSDPTKVVGTSKTDALGNGKVDMPLAPAVIEGSAFIDVNQDGLQDPAEPVLASSYVDIKWPNGSLFTRATTNTTGGFALRTIPVPNQNFTVYSPSGVKVDTFTTDAFGDATVPVAIPPPLVSGRIWFALSNASSFVDGTDVALAGRALQLKAPNGSIYADVTTDADGEFSSLADVAKALPGATITVVDAATKQVYGTITLNGIGAGRVEIPMPPAQIQGMIWYDTNTNGLQEPTEAPLNNAAITITWANGTDFMSLTTDAKGVFSFVTLPYPNETFSVVNADGVVLDTFMTKSDGSATVLVAIPPPQVGGTVYWDLDKDQNFTSADAPLANEPLALLFSDGTIYANATTNANGSFVYVPKLPSPNSMYTVVKTSDMSTPLGTVTTDPMGNAMVNIPMVGANIQGTVWLDVNKDGVQDASETVLADSFVDIKWPNGNLLDRVATNSTGGFDLPVIPYAEQNFTIYLTTGSPLKTFTTDAQGNAFVPTPIPPPLITGKHYWDSNNNTVFDATGDVPIEGKVLDLYFPNGTLYISVTTDANGDFVLMPAEKLPNVQLSVVDQAKPTPPMGVLALDQYGAGHANLPIVPPPPQIMAQICWDMNADGNCDSTDVAYASRPVQLRYKNGTTYMTGTVSENGTLVLDVYNPSPRATFDILSPQDYLTPLGTFVVDGLGAANVVIPIRAPKINGTMFWDLDKGKTLTTGDVPVVGEVLTLIFFNGSVYGNMTTLQDGTFELAPTIPMPNSTLTLVRASNPSAPLATVRTDVLGNGEALIALTPADIQGTACLDLNNNGQCGSEDTPLANSFLIVTAVGGLFSAQPKTGSNGAFVLPTVPMANQTFVVAGPDGVAVKNFTTRPDGTATVSVPIPAAVLSGALWYDFSKDGVPDAGEPGYANKVVNIYFANGSVLATATTNSTGGFRAPVFPQPGATLTIKTPDGLVTKDFTTDSTGYGEVLYPIASALIQGSAWMELNLNNIKDANEQPLNNSFVELHWPNGTLLVKVATDANGAFSAPVIPFPKQNFTVSLVGGQPIKMFTTDNNGDASVPVPIPTPVLTGTLYYDLNNDTLLDGGDKPYVNHTLQIRFPNGSIYATVVTDDAGSFELVPKALVPSMNLPVVDPTQPGKILGYLKTDSTGSGHADLPVLQVTISGKVWFDYVRNNISDATGDLPYRDQIIQLRWANGTMYTETLVKLTGNYTFPVTDPEPGTTFNIVPQSDPNLVLGTVTVNTFGAGMKDLPLPPPTIIGTLWWDLDRDAIYTSADDPLYNKPLVLLLPDGSIYANVTTMTNGTFMTSPSPPMPNTELTLVMADDITFAITKFSTDPVGNGQLRLPLTPAQIRGNVWIDTNKDTVQDFGEVTVANSFLDIRWPNNTLLKRVPTDANGDFDMALIPYPVQSFKIISSGGVVLKTFTTDQSGNAVLPIPIPPPIITGKVWFDLNNDTTYTDASPTDIAWTDRVFSLRFANSTIYTNVTIDAAGDFRFEPSIDNAAPNVVVTVVDVADNKVYGTFTLDYTGSGDKQIPIPPAQIMGNAWYDLNKNGAYDSGEVTLASSYLDVFWPNGTLFERFVTDANGDFSVDSIPYANQPFEMVLPNGIPVKNFTTNALGNAVVKVPINVPAVSLKMFYDYNGDLAFNSIDKPIGNFTVDLNLPDGRLYASQATGPAGSFTLYFYGDINPNVNVTVTDPASGTTIGSIALDEFGSGHSDIALQPLPPTVSAIICFDTSADNKCDGADWPYNAVDVVLKHGNGSVVGESTIGADGNATFGVGSRMPNSQMSICLKSDIAKCLGTVTTDQWGDGATSIPLVVPTITGVMWYDYNNDSAKTVAGDLPLSESVVISLPNGTIYANVTTGATGAFSLRPGIPYPEGTLTLYRNVDLTKAVATINTDQFGNGNTTIPIAPATIQLTAWYDTNLDGIPDSGELPYPSLSVKFRQLGGSVLSGTVTTDSAGLATYVFPAEYPNTDFEILEASNNTLFSLFTTDAVGNGLAFVGAQV